MYFTLLNETEIAALQLDKRNSYFRMKQIMNTTALPLHVIVKQLANTPWSTLPEPLLRTIHDTLYTTGTNLMLKTLTISKYLKDINKKQVDIDVTYSYEDVGLSNPILVIDEVFVLGVNITELLSDKAREQIEKEAERFLLGENLSSTIAAKFGG